MALDGGGSGGDGLRRLLRGTRAHAREDQRAGPDEARFLDHRVLGEMNVLGEMADGVSRRRRNRACVLVLFAQDHSEERGFAVAVPAHEPHALAGVYGEADAVKKRLLAVGFFDVRDLKHFFSPL